MELSRRSFLALSASLLRESTEKGPFIQEVSRGTPTLYGTDDSLMNYNVLFQCGLSLDIEHTPQFHHIFMSGVTQDWQTHGLITDENRFRKITARLPGGAQFPKRLYQSDRPVFVAPDPRHFTRKFKRVHTPHDIIGREVILQPEYYYDSMGQRVDDTREMPAYIFDVLADASRRQYPNHFNDMNPSSFLTLLGITTNTQPPWFQVGPQVLNTIPEVTMYFDRRQVMSSHLRNVIDYLLAQE